MFYGITCLLFFIDFFTKQWMQSHLNLNDTVNVFPGWIHWHLIHNSGASFGVLSGYTQLLRVVSFIAILVIYFVYRKIETKSILENIGFSLVISGAIGNFIDRLRFGYVIDFIEFRWWPAIFNAADMEIRSGAVLLIWLFIMKRWQLVKYKNIT